MSRNMWPVSSGLRTLAPAMLMNFFNSAWVSGSRGGVSSPCRLQISAEATLEPPPRTRMPMRFPEGGLT